MLIHTAKPIALIELSASVGIAREAEARIVNKKNYV